MGNVSKPPTLNDDQRAVDIYRKAATIIREKGFGATSMGDIAEAVDLTKGGLYYYIKGKEALLFAIMCFAMDQLEKKVLRPASELETPAERVARFVAGHLAMVLDEPPAMIILADEEEALAANHRERIASRRASYVDFLMQAVEELAGSTSDGAGDARSEVAARSLLAMIEGVVRWYDPSDSTIERAGLEKQIVNMALRSLEPGSNPGHREPRAREDVAVA